MIHLRKVLIGAFLSTIFLGGCNEDTNHGQLEETIQALVSDEMTGRLTGTRGNDLALTFIDEKFQEIGLEPISENTDTLLLQYPHKFYNPEKAKYEIEIFSDSGDVTELKRGVDYLERTGFSNYEETLPFTFDIQSPKLEQSYIVLKDRSNFQEAFGKAKGIFILEDTFTKSLQIDSIDKPIIQISKETYNRLKKISNGKIMMNMTVEEEMIDAYNIAGKISGENNKNAIVLSAHFDHVGTVGDSIYRGAIDNASGVAVLLEIAEVLGSSTKKFDSDIIIVAFNGEESGLQGSYHFVKELEDKYSSIYNINLDSLYGTPLSIVSQEDEVSDELLDDLISVFKDNSVDCIADLSGGLTSDHSNFLHYHINALTISSQDVSPKIHHRLDTIKEIDFSSLMKISDTIIQFINNYHHKEYTHTHENDHNNENSISQVGQEIDPEFQKIEKSKLKHNEYVLKQKEDMYYLIENQDYTFTDLQDFKLYYPKIQYELTIDQYQLNAINIFNLYSDEIDVYELEDDKVYTHELRTDDLFSLSFSYSSINDEKQKLNIELSKDVPVENTELVYEEMVINDIPYTLHYSSDKDFLYSFSYDQEINGLKYRVSITKGEEVIAELEGIQSTGIKTSLSKEDVKHLIEDININEVTLKTLKSF